MGEITEPRREIPVLDEADVLVAGGGVAGVAAAVAAARAGAKTVLVERMGVLGGVASAALMTSITNFAFTGDGRLVTRGILEEVLDKLGERAATTPDWRTRKLPQWPFDQEVFRHLLVEMVMDAGVETYLETWVTDVLKEGSLLRGVTTESKGGRQAILAQQFVDATGDADLAAWAGAPVRNTPPDSGSLLFQMRGVDIEAIVEYFETHPEEWQQYSDRVTPVEDFIANWRERGVFHLPHWGAQKMSLIREAIARGDYARDVGLCQAIDVFGMFAYRSSGAVLINSCNFAIDHLDIRTHSRAEMEARRLIPYIAEFLVKHFPGFEKAYVSESAAVTGVRYTRWIDAGFDLTAQQVADGATFDDVIGVQTAYYRHSRGGVVHPPRSHDVPYRIMLPQGVDNVVIGSGKSVSTDPRGLVRGQASCYLIGQGAGVACAVAARSGTSARGVSITSVQEELLKQNVYLGEPDRLAQLGLASV
ncbi:MAG: FAD-dependent oxidoreductase [Anaerolineae bacterium]|nr:FAD-dependent oxidoreductase [Anaerolineae bacterium]